MKPLLIPPISMPMRQYAVQANAILGLRGSGKSQGAGYIAEQMMDDKIPIVVFDPAGIWRNLKIPGRGKGYPVVVAHPESGDLPLTPQSAPQILRAAMASGVSLVIDLFSKNLSKNDWRRIVTECCHILLHENKTLRHLFIEEAAEFVPQRIRPGHGECYGAVEQLHRIGGNSSVGCTLINPRAEGVNKEVLENCDCMIVLRQKGKNSLTSLGKWIDLSDPAMSKKVVMSLKGLTPGQCWIFPKEDENPMLCQFPLKQSFHPDRQNPSAHSIGKAVDVWAFVTELSGSLEKVIAEAKENDPKELQKQIRELRKTIEQERTERTEPEVKTVEVAAFTEKDVLEMGKVVSAVKELREELAGGLATITGLLPGIVDKVRAVTDRSHVSHRANMPTLRQVMKAEKFVREKNTYPGKQSERNGSLGKCERAILTALAQYPQGRTAAQVAVLTVYSVNSGGFNNSLASLRTQGFITRGGNPQLTQAGMQALGDFDPLPTGDELLRYWMSKLGKCERAILEVVSSQYPQSVTVGELGEGTGYSPSSGGFNNSLSRLRTLELITRGQLIKASEHLFQ